MNRRSLPENAHRATMPLAAFTLSERGARVVVDWIDALAALTPDEWLAVARAYPRRGDDRCGAAAARARTGSLIASHHLEITAWFVRDLVETATYSTRRHLDAAEAHWRCRFADARVDAEWAALALLTRRWLTRDELSLALAPFDGVLPRDGVARVPATCRASARSPTRRPPSPAG